MNISEFRKDLKNQFNEALKTPVQIERGGVMFELTAKGLIGTVVTQYADLDRAEFVPANVRPKLPPVAKRPSVPPIPGVSVGFCPHGFAKGLCKIEACNKKYKKTQ